MTVWDLIVALQHQKMDAEVVTFKASCDEQEAEETTVVVELQSGKVLVE